MFHTVFVQISNKNHPVHNAAPAARILRAVNNPEKVELARNLIRAAFPKSTVLEIKRGQVFPITNSPKDESYRDTKAAKLVQDAEAALKHEVSDYKQSRRLKRSGDDGIMEAHKQLISYRDRWNERPWVKLMKKRYNISEDEIINPGSGMWYTNAAAAADDDLGVVSLDNEITMAVPDGIKSTTQNYAVISMYEDEHDELIEPGIVVLSIHTDLEDARNQSRMASTMKEAHPGDTYVVDVGDWILPLDVFWNDTIIETQEYANEEMQKFQEGRRERVDGYQKGKALFETARQENEARITEVADQLGLRPDQVELISKDPKGVNDLIDALKISTKACREDAVDQLRVSYLGADPDAL